MGLFRCHLHPDAARGMMSGNFYSLRMPIDAFLCAWDALEAANPFGINHFTPFFLNFGIPGELCAYVDRDLYVDMMVPLHVGVRRFKIERRQSSTVSWMFVGILSDSSLFVAFQATPTARFTSVFTIEATPRALIETLVLNHGRRVGPLPRGRVRMCAKGHRAAT